MTKTKFEPGRVLQRVIKACTGNDCPMTTHAQLLRQHERRIVIAFVAEVNQRAEAAIIKGGPMTGAHMRAMLEVLEEYEK